MSLSINSTIFINENSSLLFNNGNINFITKYSIYIYNNSLINLNVTDSNTLFFQTNYGCNYNNKTKLYIYDNSIISTINGAKIKYYGSDIFILSSTSIINSSVSTIIISEQCSNLNSLLIGGTKEI